MFQNDPFCNSEIVGKIYKRCFMHSTAKTTTHLIVLEPPLKTDQQVTGPAFIEMQS